MRQRKNRCNLMKISERAYKPDSVFAAKSHRSPRAAILSLDAEAIIPLGRRSLDGSSSLPEGLNGPGQPSPPIWPCTARGLPCRGHCCPRGGLLPYRFTLTKWRDLRRPHEVWPRADHRCRVHRRFIFCGTVRSPTPESGVRPPGVTRRAALRSPDFPPGFSLSGFTQRSPSPLARAIITYSALAKAGSRVANQKSVCVDFLADLRAEGDAPFAARPPAFFSSAGAGRAANFPSSSASNSSSVRVRTPRVFALSYFEPGSAPTTT